MKNNRLLTLVCLAGLTVVSACGGGKSNKNNAVAEPEAKVEEEVKDVKDMVGIEQAGYWLNEKFNLKLADVKPDFEYEAMEKGMDACMGNSGGGTIAFVRKDGAPITDEEFKAYVSRIYPLVQKCSPTGKIHKGQGKNQSNSEEVQKQELTLDAIDFSQSVDLAFPEKEDFVGYWHHIRLFNKTGDNPYILLRFN